MKKIAMLLNGPIKNDYRVIKTIETLSQNNFVHLFYINGNSADKNIFNNHVTLVNSEHKVNVKVNILRHTWFCFEFAYFKKIVNKRNIKFDIIWANDLPTLYPAYKIAKTLNAKLVFDSHEIYTETINQFFPRNSSGIKRLIFDGIIYFMRAHGKRIEKKIIPNTDLFITVNESLLQYFQNRYPIGKGIVIMNLPRMANNGVQETINLKQHFSWESKSQIVLYQGQLNEGRGIRLLVESFLILPRHYKLIIIGNGIIESELKHWVNSNFLSERIQFVNTIPLADLPSFTACADVGINLLETFNLSKQLASPNKLFEYIHAGIPIVASNTIENQRVFEKFKIGILTENTPAEIAEAIIQVASQDKRIYQQALLDAKRCYHWENQEESLNSMINTGL